MLAQGFLTRCGKSPVTLLMSGKVYAFKDNHEIPNDSSEFLDYFDLFFFFNSTHFRPYTVNSWPGILFSEG